MNRRSERISYSEMSHNKLGVYIMDIQYPYLKKALATFILCSKKIGETDNSEPKSTILVDSLLELSKLIEHHLMQDEQVLFPYLRAKIDRNEYYSFNDIPISLSTLRSEYYIITGHFNKLRLLSNNYTPLSNSASPALKLCYAQLFDFEQDMLKHFFLEEELFFTKLHR